MPVNFRFWKCSKSPSDVIRQLNESVQYLIKEDQKTDKAREDVKKNLGFIKIMLIGSKTNAPSSELVLLQLVNEIYNKNILLFLIENLEKFDFETRKDVALIFSNILRRDDGNHFTTIVHICSKPEIIFLLLKGYEHREIALNTGVMLRECCRYEELAKIILYSDEFLQFFKYIEQPSFDVASDAFFTFRDLLTRHKAICSEYLEKNYDKFYSNYLKMLTSDNYVTKRQSFKLLSDLITDRYNFGFMVRYVNDADNLKLAMNTMRVKSKNIQFEAFQVFKVFVANSKKPKAIHNILLRNKMKIVDFLRDFLTERCEDEDFCDEKAFVIKTVHELKPIDE